MTLDEILAKIHDADDKLAVARSADEAAQTSAQAAQDAQQRSTVDAGAASSAHATAADAFREAIADLTAYSGLNTAKPAAAAGPGQQPVRPGQQPARPGQQVQAGRR